MRVFITGAGGGIGSAIKEVYESKGWQVIAPRSSELDLSDISSIQKWFEENPADFDAVIHCAGYNHPMPITEMNQEELPSS